MKTIVVLLQVIFFSLYGFCGMPSESDELMSKVMENDLEAVKKLLDEGADVNVRDKQYGTTPLMIACSYEGYTDMVKLLLSYHPDVNIQDKVYGNTALIAAAGVSKEVVELLLENGADIHISGFNGTTAFVASITGVLADRVTTDIASLLLSKGADINHPLALEGGEGMTCLMMVVKNERMDLVKFLIENGADVNIKAKDGSTALSIALENGYTDIVNYLKEHGAE
jgi:ankyrin repeat protein